MPILVLCIVLGAALTHATWNLFLKQTGDRMAMMCVMHTVTGMLALAAMPWIGGIIAPESWPLLLTSVVIHGGYYLFLIRSYTHGDLGFTYPIARGMAPLNSTSATGPFGTSSKRPFGLGSEANGGW